MTCILKKTLIFIINKIIYSYSSNIMYDVNTSGCKAELTELDEHCLERSHQRPYVPVEQQVAPNQNPNKNDDQR